MKWTLHIVKQARKNISRIPQKDRGYIVNALREMTNSPLNGDVAWLKDQPATFRRRVGSWRILFDVRFEEHIIMVLDVKRRSSKTY